MGGGGLLIVGVGVVVVVRAANAEAGLVGFPALHRNAVPVQRTRTVLQGFTAPLLLDVHYLSIITGGEGAFMQ